MSYIEKLNVQGTEYIILDNQAVHLNSANVKTVDKDETVSNMFSSVNSTYIISHSIDAKGATITVPKDCTLIFIDGSIKNATIVLDNTTIYGKYCFSNVNLSGTTDYIDTNWFEDDYEALCKCLALADVNSHVLDVTRDLHIKFTTSIKTSSSIDFHGHKLTVDFNGYYNPQIFIFCNTETKWYEYGQELFTNILNLVNAGEVTRYPDECKDKIIEIYSSSEVEVYRYGYSNIYLHEMLYVDEYGDLYGNVWNKDIPVSSAINIRMHSKLTNEIYLKNCIYEMIYDNTTSSSSVYRKNGIKFQNCFNAKIENLTIYSNNGNEFKNRENGILDFQAVQYLTVKNVYLKSSSDKNLATESSYGILMSYVNDALFENVRSSSMSNSHVWGIMGSNLVYNVKYINCDLSRIDTHWRCVNMDVDHCNIGHHGIHYSGAGIYNITNSNFKYYGFYTREEYAAYFDGVINVSNCKFEIQPPSKPASAGTFGLFKISPIVDTHAKYKMRGRDIFYCGAKQINLDNIYIDCPNNDMLELSLIRLTSTNYENTGSMKVVVPNVYVRNLTHNYNKKKKSLSLLYHTLKNVEYANEPTYVIENCKDAFSHQMDVDFSKYLHKGLCCWNVDVPMPKSKMIISNSNLWVGQEPAEWDCYYRDCDIEGVYMTEDVRLISNKTFSNCVFKFNSDLDSSPFSNLKGSLMRFFNCVFDAPVNEKHNDSAKNFYNIYDIDGGWTIAYRVENKIMSGCIPTSKLCEILNKNQSDFVNINNITKN